MNQGSGATYVKNQQAASLNNPLAFNSVPHEIINKYLEQLPQQRKRLYKYDPYLIESELIKNTYLNSKSTPDIEPARDYFNPTYNYQEYINNGGQYQQYDNEQYAYYQSYQREPRKDVQMYLSTKDIEGAQPRKFQMSRGKKRLNFFEDQQQLNETTGSSNHRYLLHQKHDTNNNNHSQISLPDINQTNSSNFQVIANNQKYTPTLLSNSSLQRDRSKLFLKQTSSGLKPTSSQEVFDSMSNFDKLYNKRVDWRPVVINAQKELKGQTQKITQANLNNTFMNREAQQITTMSRQLKGNKKNESQVNYCMSLGVGMPKKQETSSNNYGKYTYIRPF